VITFADLRPRVIRDVRLFPFLFLHHPLRRFPAWDLIAFLLIDRCELMGAGYRVPLDWLFVKTKVAVDLDASPKQAMVKFDKREKIGSFDFDSFKIKLRSELNLKI
jgi:hypothetical protein